MMRFGHYNSPSRHRGTVLVLTIFIVMALAAIVVVFTQEARVEAGGAANIRAQRQAHFIAMGGIRYAMTAALETPGNIPTEDDMDAEAVPAGRGYFWLLRPEAVSDDGMVFGIHDETSKLNVNTVTRDMLIMLPLMTDELADSMIDWRDGDSESEPAGAENDYYLSMDEPYYCKDAPYETLEEILLVRGGTTELVYGEDTNYNNLLDPNEDDGEESEPYDNGDRSLDRGLIDFLTVYTMAPAASNEDPAVDVNDANPAGMQEVLQEELGIADAEAMALLITAGRPYRNLVDFALRSQLKTAEFDTIKHRITVGSGRGGGPFGGLFGGGDGGDGQAEFGKVNINTAPEEVIAALPGLTAADVDSIIGTRNSTDLTESPMGWITEALEPTKAVDIGDYITYQSFQFTVDVLAVSAHGRSFKRYRAVIDVSSAPGSILHFEDLTPLGWPLEPELLDQLRSGEFEGPGGSIMR